MMFHVKHSVRRTRCPSLPRRQSKQMAASHWTLGFQVCYNIVIPRGERHLLFTYKKIGSVSD